VTIFLQTLLDGIAVGSLYGLIALGYTMVYGILQFINFAHSDIFMLGAWISYTISSFAISRLVGADGQIPEGPLFYILLPLLTILGAMAACGLIGFFVERGAYRPLRKAPRLNVLITAIGVSLFLQNVGQLHWLFGTQPRGFPDVLPDTTIFTVAGVQVHVVDVIVIFGTMALMLALEWLVHRTKLGMAMRAVSYDTRVASLMGVNVDRVISFTFVLGSSLAAAAGFLYAAKYHKLGQPADATWVLLGLKAFVAAVVGGIGNIRGAMLGGLAIGLIEFFGKAYIEPAYADVYVFSILIAVLLFKPTGILGKRLIEKV